MPSSRNNPRLDHRGRHVILWDAAAGDADKFPPFAFIEPAYLQPGANDAHPPHDIIGADGLIASVYNALRKNDKLWGSTLLLVLFDEHGGFYDHVVQVLDTGDPYKPAKCEASTIKPQ